MTTRTTTLRLAGLLLILTLAAGLCLLGCGKKEPPPPPEAPVEQPVDVTGDEEAVDIEEPADEVEDVVAAVPVEDEPEVDAVKADLPTDLPAQDYIDMLPGGRGKEGKAIRKAARDVLIGRGADVIPELVKRMDDADFTVRWEMVNICGYIRDHAAIEPLAREILTDDNPHIRWRGLWALKLCDDGTSQGRFLERIEDEDEVTVWRTAVALSMFESNAGVPILTAGIKEQVGFERWEAVNALGRVQDETTVGVLADLLDDHESRIRNEAAVSLGRIGKGARAAVPALLDTAQNGDKGTRWRCIMALQQIGGPGLKAAFEGMLAEEEAKPEDERDELFLDHLHKAIPKAED